MTNINRIDRDYRDDFCTRRAITYLNFALHLRIDPRTAASIASDALDDDSNALDIADTPTPTDARMMLLALANESFNSDDDFDDFMHELDHALRDCSDPDYCAAD
jgi:hypothetical protein